MAYAEGGGYRGRILDIKMYLFIFRNFSQKFGNMMTVFIIYSPAVRAIIIYIPDSKKDKKNSSRIQWKSVSSEGPK